MTTKQVEKTVETKPETKMENEKSPKPSENQNMAKKVETLRNISVKSVIKKDKKTLLKEVEEGKTGPRMQVIGEVYRFKTRDGEYGVMTCFVGAFVAKNMETGALYQSDEAYFPQVYTEELTAKINELKEGEAVKIKSEISIFESDKSGTGYAFVAKDIQSPETYQKQQAIVDSLLSGGF